MSSRRKMSTRAKPQINPRGRKIRNRTNVSQKVVAIGVGLSFEIVSRSLAFLRRAPHRSLLVPYCH